MFSAIATIAYRDFIKFIRDRSRIIASFIFPFVFIGILGSSIQSNLGKNIGYNFLLFTFIGVIGQTLFQSTASGIISLVEDRENDFSQEMFIAPVSRFVIIFGKIVGESMVAFAQILGIIIIGIILRVPIDPIRLLQILPFTIVASIIGGAFGIFVLSNLSSQRSANQIFPFIILPQFFLSGVFSPIKELPPVLFVLSRMAPMTYAVDFVRGLYYMGKPEYAKVVLYNPLFDFIVLSGMFIIFLIAGTILYVKKERNR